MATVGQPKSKQLRHFDCERRCDRKAEDDERFNARGLSRVIGCGWRDDQLLPKPL